MHRGWDGKVATSSKNPAEDAVRVGSARTLTTRRADIVVEGGVRTWWIREGLAGRAEAFDGSTLVAGTKGSTAIARLSLEPKEAVVILPVERRVAGPDDQTEACRWHVIVALGSRENRQGSKGQSCELHVVAVSVCGCC